MGKRIDFSYSITHPEDHPPEKSVTLFERTVLINNEAIQQHTVRESSDVNFGKKPKNAEKTEARYLESALSLPRADLQAATTSAPLCQHSSMSGRRLTGCWPSPSMTTATSPWAWESPA